MMRPETPEVLAAQLERLRKRIRAVAAAGGIGLTLLIIATFVGLALLSDFFIELPLFLRVGLLIATIVAAALGLIFAILRPVIQVLEDAELAALVETQFPELNERLLSTVEFSAHPDESASPVMRKWLLQETVKLSKQFDFSDAIDATRAVRRCWWGGMACLALLLPLLFAGDAYAVLISRFINPWGNYERVQNLILTVEPGHQVIAASSDVTIRAEVSWRFREGTIPATAWLEWTTDQGKTEARRLDWDAEEKHYSGTLTRVEQNLSYHVATEGSRTQSYRIEVAPRPEMEQLEIEISPPAYTGLPAQLHDLALGEIEVIEQSRWEVSASFNKPVKQAELLWLDGKAKAIGTEPPETLPDGLPVIARTELPLSADGRTALLRETLALESPSGRFVIRATDENGLTSDTSLRRRLTITPDEAPQLRFLDGEDSSAAQPTDILDIPIAVADDFGIASLELHYEIIRNEALREPGVLTIENFVGGERELNHLFRLDLATLALQPGMRLTMRARATDERPVPKPNEAWTVTRFLMIREDAKPYGDQTLAEQQQQTQQVLEALKSEIEQQRDKAEELEQAAKAAEAEQKPWNADEEQLLSEKLDELQQQLEKLSALFDQQPLFEKLGAQAQEIAEGSLKEAAQQIEQAQQAELQQKPQEFAEAARNLEQAADQIAEMQQKHQQLAELQRDLLELGRLANQTERLANNVEDLETRQKEMQSAEAAPAESIQKAWEQDQRQAWKDHQQLSETMNGLFERRPELADAAAEVLQQQLQQLGKQAEQLARQQQALAAAAKESAQKAAEQLQTSQVKQNEISQAAAELAKQLKAPEELETSTALKESLQKASDSMRAGDTAAATAAERQAQQAVQKLAEQLNQQVQQAADKGESTADQEMLAAQAEQMAQQLGNAVKQLESMLSQPADNSSPPAPPVPNQPEASDLSQIPKQQQSVADLAQQLNEALQNMEPANEAATEAAQQFAQQSQQSSAQAQQLKSGDAAEQARQAAASAQQLADALQESQAPQPVRTAAEAAANQQAQLAEQLQRLADDEQAQAQMQLQLQQRTAEETERLSEQLQRTAEEFVSKPLNKQTESNQTQQARTAASQAAEQMSQAQQQQSENNAGQASQKSQQAAESLSRAARNAMQAASSNAEEASPVPSEVGQQVTQAARQLNAAGQKLQQLGAPQPGSPGDQQGQGEPGSEQAMNGGDGEGQQRPEQQQPSPSAQQMSPSKALRQAAQSMRTAAGQMSMAQNGQQPSDSQQQQQEGGNGSGDQASDFGSTQQLAELLQMQADFSKATKRDWGQLPGELQTELLESSRKKASGEYQPLIRRYFNDISKARSPDMKAAP